MCPIQDFTFRNYFRNIFCCEGQFIIKNQSRNIIFFYKMMNLNFPSSNKVLGLGRSILWKTFHHFSACRVSQIPAHRDIPLIFLRFGFGLQYRQWPFFSKFIVSFLT
jgi:hypothetical protein